MLANEKCLTGKSDSLKWTNMIEIVECVNWDEKTQIRNSEKRLCLQEEKVTSILKTNKKKGGKQPQKGKSHSGWSTNGERRQRTQKA